MTITAEPTAPTTLTGNAAIRHIAAELLAQADVLGITVKSLTVGLYYDQTPAEAHVWFYSYADAQAFADFYGIGDRVNFNSEVGSRLLYMGRASYDLGAPTLAGVRCGLRLVCDKPEA